MKLWRYGQPIEVLGDRYHLEGMLGSGGMADVCLAFDEYEQRHIAIKIVKAEAAADQDMLNRFVKEAGQVVGWQHPHILRVYDQMRVELIKQPSGQDNMLFYIVMEYASGGDLQKRITPGEPYSSLSTAFTIFRQICGAVQYAHKHGVIHRDIKPLNILFRKPRTGPEEAVLSDFGLAVQIDASHHTFAEAGSFSYMAPEQFRGRAEPASDIFALGVTLYQLLTGSLPFSREMQDISEIFAGEEPEPLPLSQINTTLPAALDEVIIQALHPDPAYRYPRAAAFWNTIVSALETATLPSEQQPGQPQGGNSPLPPQPSVLRASRQSRLDPTGEGEYDESGPTNLATRAARPNHPLVLRGSSQTERRIPDTQTARRDPDTRIERSSETTMRRSLVQRSAGLQPSALPQTWRSRRVLLPATILAGLLVVGILLLVVPPLFAITTITITPRSQVEQHSYTFSSDQIHARQLSATASPQSNTGNVSGTIAAAKAHGTLIFINDTPNDMTVQTMTFTGKSGVAVTFKGPVTIPANPPTTSIPAFAVNAGAAGNIPQLDITKTVFQDAQGNPELVVKNTAFSGGEDTQQNDKVQQSDIDQAAKSLTSTQTQQEQSTLASQLHKGEQVVKNSQHCQPTVTPDSPAGAQAKTVTVTVTVTCTEVVYDPSAAQALATSQLSAQATQDLGATYQQDGPIVLTMTSATVTDNGNQITLNAQARGLWAYVFSTERLSQLANLVAGKSPSSARAILLSQPGVAGVQLPTGGMLPTANRLQVKVQLP